MKAIVSVFGNGQPALDEVLAGFVLFCFVLNFGQRQWSSFKLSKKETPMAERW